MILVLIYFHIFVAGNDSLLKLVSQSHRRFPFEPLKNPMVKIVINGFYNQTILQFDHSVELERPASAETAAL